MDHITHFFPGYIRPFQPMLAAKCPRGMPQNDFLRMLRLPLWETPKIDGIRCLTVDLPGDRSSWYSLPITRHCKPQPNDYVRRMIGESCPYGLDGELVVVDDDGGVRGYYETSSGLLSHDGQPNFRFLVFDYITPETRLDGYLKRVEQLRALTLPAFCRVLTPTQVKTLDDLMARVNQRMDEGFEGSCLRTGSHEYKFGRSSLRQQGLVAVKLYVDSDADVTGYYQLMRNTGEAIINPQGHKYRRRRAEDLVPDDLLGGLIGKDVDTGAEVRVGSGFTMAQRAELWTNRGTLKGRRFKYKHQPFGALENGKPRQPTFIGFRES